MKQHRVTVRPEGLSIPVEEGTVLQQALSQAGIRTEAPCGGRGTCGKCKVTLVDGTQVLACQTRVDRDLTVILPKATREQILTDGFPADVCPDGTDRYAMAFDIGTTTIAAYLLDGLTGRELGQASCINPQTRFGGDVVSRLQYAIKQGSDPLSICVLETVSELARKLCSGCGIKPEDVTISALAGNTAMHHLLLGIDPRPLVTPPYMPGVKAAMEQESSGLLPTAGMVRTLPNIAGFVGGDTVGCMAAVRFDELEELTLLIDIGTNGEMVLGNKSRRIACSTAAGPAFEGARISCGMRGSTGAVDHVKLENGKIGFHVIGEGEARGLCGSGLLDLVAVLLDMGFIGENGRMKEKSYTLTNEVALTQKDIREVQLAKAAIRAGIELLAEEMGVSVGDIRRVYLAGAFGNYMDSVSACRIGMIPPVLLDRIIPIGNAAGTGTKLCALSRAEFERSKSLAAETEFLELATLPQFQDCYLSQLNFPAGLQFERECGILGE